MHILHHEAAVEAILFASGGAVKLKDIAEAIGEEINATRALVNNLADRYLAEKRGIMIIAIEDSYQMCTNTAYFDYIKKLYQVPSRKNLSQTILETLAIIAYKQPITKGQIEEIRGVNAEHAVNKLVEYGLVEERGRMNSPGKPILFGTTENFLRYFEFTGLDAMPEVTEDKQYLEQLVLNELGEIE